MGRAPDGKPIDVVWLDSCGPDASGPWFSLDDYDVRPCVMRTRGFLVRERKTYIVVAASLAQSGRVAGVITIPKCSIVERAADS